MAVKKVKAAQNYKILPFPMVLWFSAFFFSADNSSFNSNFVLERFILKVRPKNNP